MKKQEIKADPIRDKIVASAQFLSDNSQKAWLVLGVLGIFIILTSLYSNNKKNKDLENNATISLLQNEIIYGTEYSDSLLNQKFEEVLNNMNPSESYNQAFIYLLSDAIKNNNQDKIKSLLDNNKFKSKDDMLNSFILKVKGDIAVDDNAKDAIMHYKNAIKIVPSYDLKVSYSIDLIELYLKNSNLEDANKAFVNIKNITSNVDNLPRNAQNNLDYIDYKLKQLSQ